MLVPFLWSENIWLLTSTATVLHVYGGMQVVESGL